MQIIFMNSSVDSASDSAASGVDVLQLKLRYTAALPQTLCSSALDDCRVCMQKR